MEEIIIDGSYGEGGGQILRTSLALSMVTGRPVQIKNIRAKRAKPGIMRQHLCAIEAATEISNAKVKGARVGSSELSFEPGDIKSGEYHFSIGSAGSTSLVFQTIFPALITKKEETKLVIEGGTHNPFAPCFDFLNETFLPLIRKIGFDVELSLERHGFYPAGGGKINVSIKPSKNLKVLNIENPEKDVNINATAMIAHLPLGIASRELEVLKEKLNLQDGNLNVLEIKESNGPGNALLVRLSNQTLCEVMIEYGRIGVSAEKVAYTLVSEVESYLKSTSSVGKYLADQLLIPMALASGGGFITMKPTQHFKTNVFIMEKFIGKCVSYQQLEDGAWKVTVKGMDK